VTGVSGITTPREWLTRGDVTASIRASSLLHFCVDSLFKGTLRELKKAGTLVSGSFGCRRHLPGPGQRTVHSESRLGGAAPR
jgi:hypothetical protein